MKKLLFTKVLSCVVVSFVFVLSAYAADYNVSLPQMPPHAINPEKGIMVDLVKAIAKETGKDMSIVVVPFARSMNNVVTGKADFHMPLIAISGIDQSTLPYAYSTETIFHVNFVMYTKKGSKITKDNLSTAKVETDIQHIPYFDFKVQGSSNIVNSLKKVNAGRIDAFIFADSATDPKIKSNNLTNIKRELYKVFDVKIILPAGGKGGPTDTFLSEAIAKLKANGTYEKIIGPVDMPYDNWQP